MNVHEKRARYAALIKELETGTKDMAAGCADPEALEQKAAEADALATELAAADRVEASLRRSREAVEPVLPPGGKQAAPGERGTSSVGQQFIESAEFRDYVAAGTPSGIPSRKFLTPSLTEQKAAITLASGVVLPSRDGDVVRSPEQDRLTLRDVLNVARTDSNAVSYVILTPGAQVAAPVAEGAVKPEASLALTEAQAPVRTIAAWQAVSEQTLQDVGVVQNIVDSELRYQLSRVEESQILYGDGIGQNLQGIVTLAGVPAITRGATHLLDRIRAGITDVQSAGGEPNAIVAHPLDVEAILMLKSTDGQYLNPAIVFDAATGRLRVWGVPVVSTLAAQAPAATTRTLVVGDFRRGATLYDRRQATVELGWINDQFTRNLRTIRAEERIAFGIKRPTFFAKFQTAI